MHRVERTVLIKHRRRLLRSLSGEILEIGSGTGINFSLYGPDAHVIAAEPSQAMMNVALDRIKKEKPQARITPIVAGVGSAELSAVVTPGSIDVVVSTLVLCTVPDPEQAMAFIASRLRPGGRLVLMEHIQAAGALGRTLQNLINPLWKKFAHGCHVNRNTPLLAKNAGFQVVREESFQVTLPFYEAVLVKP